MPRKASSEPISGRVWASVGCSSSTTASQITGSADSKLSRGTACSAAPNSDESARIAATVLVPCSMGTLARVAHGFSSNLVERMADVALKEGRPLLVVPRETPLHLGHLRNMTAVTEYGGIIAPPVPAFYAQPQTLQDIVDHSVGRVLDLFDIDSGLVKRWQGVGATVAAARGAIAED